MINGFQESVSYSPSEGRRRREGGGGGLLQMGKKGKRKWGVRQEVRREGEEEGRRGR